MIRRLHDTDDLVRAFPRVHFVGIGGTGMSGIAEVMLTLGYEVSGSDAADNAATRRLARLGARVVQGHSAANVLGTDCVVVSSAIRDDNPELMEARSQRIPIVPRAAMLAELMRFRRGIAVAGTHGKTTTTTILTYLLDAAGRSPGFLIGGVAEDFGVSARVGAGREFVVEADEYDTAFFDKRSKFVHYRPLVAILNNLEYDHADIFPDVAAIQRQFHHLVRTVPRRGRLLVNGHDERLREVLAMGCWTPVERFGFDASFEWSARKLREDGSAFAVVHAGRELGIVEWPLLGDHNVLNGLAALAACHAVGVDVASAIPSLAAFSSVKRRMEVIGEHAGITVYDDFAHHPTAIQTTLAGLRAKVGDARIVVAMEPRSNSMRLGAHAEALAPSLGIADSVVFLARPELPWDADKVIAAIRGEARAVAGADALIARLREAVRAGDHVVFMSNGGFDGAPRRFLAALRDA